jgi:hypothetical protein
MTTKGPYAEMAAAGTTQATAAEFTADRVMVTTVTESANGIILPPGNLDHEVEVVNGTTLTLFIYPRSGGKLNNAAADLPLQLPGNRAGRLRGVNSLNWIAFF